MTDPKLLGVLETVLHRLTAMDERLSTELKQPRPMVLLDKEQYYRERAEQYEQGLKLGVRRGERNVLTILLVLLRGEASFEHVGWEDWTERDVADFKEVYDAAERGWRKTSEPKPAN